jgi:hypothetical protein
MVSEFAVKIGKYRAKFPSLELVPNQWAPEFDQRPDMAKIDDLLQGQIRDLSASFVAIVENEIGYRPAVISS